MSRNVDEILKQWAEDRLLISKSRTAFDQTGLLSSPALDLTPAAAALNLSGLRKMDSSLKVRAGIGHTTRLITARKPMVLAGVEVLRNCHPGHNLRMTEDILSFEPDEDLINMSENPLWLIQPLGEFEVAIKRVF